MARHAFDNFTTDYRYRIVKCGRDGYYAEDASIGPNGSPGQAMTRVYERRYELLFRLSQVEDADGFTRVK